MQALSAKRVAGSRPAASRAPLTVCAASPAPAGKVYVDPTSKECAAFAPATVANLGPGFDWMGCAVEVRGANKGWITLVCV